MYRYVHLYIYMHIYKYIYIHLYITIYLLHEHDFAKVNCKGVPLMVAP
jgi:hypothetical protein